jgi:three-Cys-motif partner protein
MTEGGDIYWDEYSNLQFVKHKIIRSYLNGWFPKLGFWSGKIIYVDTHAGRGRHRRGEEGSPIIALKTFLEHRARDIILKKSELKLLFIDNSPDNASALTEELTQYEGVHPRISWSILNANSFDYLQHIMNEFEKSDLHLAPSFVFVDPYGFKVPYQVLKKIKQQPRSELFINVMWRELDMAIRNPALENILDEMFGCREWRDIKQIEESDDRAEATIQLLRTQLGAKWATYIRMIGDNERTRYFLLHLTDHEAGRDLMKDVIWNCCPDGGYYARKKDNPRQQYLILPEPDLRLLEMWLMDQLSKKDYKWSDLTELLREEIWRETHLWQVTRKLVEVKKLRCYNFKGRFSQKANPTLGLEK